MHLAEAANVLYRGLTNETKNRKVYAPAAAVLHYAAKNDLCPYLVVEKLPEKKPLTRRIPVDNMFALIDATEGYQELFLTAIYHQGWRITETLKVEWERINLEIGEVEIWINKSKTWKRIVLHPETIDGVVYTVYEMDTDNTAIPGINTISGSTEVVTDGVFFFSKFVLPPQTLLRFVGSHDPAVAFITAHFNNVIPNYTPHLTFAGSLGGLIALTEGQADLAGAHLWDEESDTYNIPFIRRLLPGRQVAVLTLAHRNLGLIVLPPNPTGITGLADLTRPGIRFINRQAGAGTRRGRPAAVR